MTKIRSLSLIAGYLLCVSCVVHVSAFASYTKEALITETAGTVRITANSPRPLEQVLDALQRKYGWVINYEDPQYVSAVDVVKAADEDAQVPAGGSFTFEFPGAAPNEERVLQQLVESYNKSKNPGHFELRHTDDGMFNVVGIAGHGEKGEIVQQQAPLDFPLSLANQEQSIDGVVNRICAEVSKKSRSNVVLAISPRKILSQNRVVVGGKKVAARELLAKGLVAAHGKIYWRLLFDPNSKSYYLDLHLARGA
jgi:hypothetical protein